MVQCFMEIIKRFNSYTRKDMQTIKRFNFASHFSLFLVHNWWFIKNSGRERFVMKNILVLQSTWLLMYTIFSSFFSGKCNHNYFIFSWMIHENKDILLRSYTYFVSTLSKWKLHKLLIRITMFLIYHFINILFEFISLVLHWWLFSCNTFAGCICWSCEVRHKRFGDLIGCGVEGDERLMFNMT